MPTSDNHGYELPNRGDPNWDVPLNDNFEGIDADVEVRDAASNRSSYTPASGAKFLATDTGVVSLGDGASWLPTLSLSRFTAPATSGAAGSLVAGHASNSVAGGANGATIAGGGFDDGGTVRPNQVADDFATVSGGRGNTASGTRSTVGGGGSNEADGGGSTIGGGDANVVDGPRSTVAGGFNNQASFQHATVCGGENNAALENGAAVAGGSDNEASGQNATVGGGLENTAGSESAVVSGGESNEAGGLHGAIAGGFNNATTGPGAAVAGGSNNSAGGSSAIAVGGAGNSAAGNTSFAAGRLANASADGTFVWGDNSTSAVSSSTPNAFAVQAGGGATIYSASDLSAGVELAAGAGSWSSLSASASKANIEPLDPAAALEGIRDLEISTWNYESQDESVRHVGPMAEDFHEEFGLGEDPERIATVDADGVALAAIQGLAAELEERDERIDAQRERIDELEEAVERLSRRDDTQRVNQTATDQPG